MVWLHLFFIDHCISDGVCGIVPSTLCHAVTVLVHSAAAAASALNCVCVLLIVVATVSIWQSVALLSAWRYHIITGHTQCVSCREKDRSAWKPQETSTEVNGAKINLHANLPTFGAAELKGFTINYMSKGVVNCSTDGTPQPFGQFTHWPIIHSRHWMGFCYLLLSALLRFIYALVV